MPKNQTSGGRRYDGNLPLAPIALGESDKVALLLNRLSAAGKLDISVESAALDGVQYSTHGPAQEAVFLNGQNALNEGKTYTVKNLKLKISGAALNEAQNALLEVFNPTHIQRKKSPLAAVSPLFGDFIEIHDARILRGLAVSGLTELQPYLAAVTPKEVAAKPKNAAHR